MVLFLQWIKISCNLERNIKVKLTLISQTIASVVRVINFTNEFVKIREISVY